MKDNLENIRTDYYEKRFQIYDNECKVIIEDAYYGEWKGNLEALDEIKVESMCRGMIEAVAKNVTKYNPVPVSITISHNNKIGGSKEKNDNIIHCIEPRYAMEDVALPKDTREHLEVTLSAVCNRKRLNEEWGLADNNGNIRPIVLNFYGHAGTGKTMSAEAIAKRLQKKCLVVNYSELESKYVGETPKNIRRAFSEAAKEDAVLVFDEADSFLSKRLTSITQSADYGVNIARSVMLMELEKFDGVVVFTTNLIENYDSAFKRRIFASIEFNLPDYEARVSIWKLHVGDRLPISSEITVEQLANKYENVSGADIKDIIYYAAVNAMDKGKGQVEASDFDMAYEYIMKRYV